MIDCNEWRTEKRHECANMGKVKRLELWWQLYRTSLPVRDLENFRPMGFCWHECTRTVHSTVREFRARVQCWTISKQENTIVTTAVPTTLYLLALQTEVSKASVRKATKKRGGGGGFTDCLLATYFSHVSIFMLVYLKMIAAQTETCSIHVRHCIG